MAEILKNVWNGPRGEGFGFKSITEERNYYQKSLDMLRQFVGNEDLEPNIFALPVSPPGNSFDDYKKIPFGDNLQLGGKLDRVDLLSDNTLEIIDYKTGKEKENNLQLLIYVFLVESLFNKKVSKATYIYLKTGNRKSVIPDEELRKQTKEQILWIVEQIGSETVWAPRISKLCAYCDYLYFCPAKTEIKKFLGAK